jgi:hypothetical protein
VAISIRTDKSFDYRGAPEQWSNRYHLGGGNPASPAEWEAIYQAITYLEAPLVPAAVSFVGASGYLSDTGAAVWTFTHPTGAEPTGTYAVGVGEHELPGDVAMWARWWCGKYSKRGKKIYLRKYFHAVFGSGVDNLAAGQKTALQTYAAAMQNGTAVPGFGARSICDKDGNGAVEHEVVTFTTIRELKRRSNSPL